MNIIKLLHSKAGKIALSAMQAVGLSAAVGVAGIATWQMVGSSSQPSPNTVFSSNDQEVIFVAGAGGDGVYGGNYGAGGEVQSGIRATLSKDMQLMQADAARAKMSNDPAFVQQEQKITAYTMDGATGGLGMDGGNAAKEIGIDGSANVGSMQQQLAALQASMQAQQKAAADAAAAGAGDAAKAAAAALGQGGGNKWGMASGMARASGSNLNATPLQAGSGVGREGGRVSSSGVLGGAEIAGAANGSDTSGLAGGRKSTSSFGQALAWGEGNNKEQLAFLQKQSADITQNRDRAANEGTRAFMASERLSGGIRLNGDTLTTGAASSSDFSADDIMSGLGAGISGVGDMIELYEKSKEELKESIEDFQRTVGISCAAALVPGLCYAWIWSPYNKTLDKIGDFQEQWGESTFETTSTNAPYSQSAKTVTNAIYNYAWGGLTGTAWWAGKVESREAWYQVFGAEQK